jgi:riboflavin kinase / FMN adenylyltransferase
VTSGDDHESPASPGAARASPATAGEPPLRRALTAIRSERPVLVLGTFDGVHLGHRALIARAVSLAQRLQRPWLPVAFFPPPKTLLAGQPFLSSEAEKRALLTEAGAAAGALPSEIVIVPFDAAFAATPADRFVRALAGVRPCRLVVGQDFRFGHRRRGAAADLAAACERLDVLPLVALGHDVVKSSLIREALDAGDVARAATLLGAPYRVTGSVVAGDRRGRALGVPTANLALDPRKALPTGVFAVRVDLPDGSRHGGMANVGPRPSFDDPVAGLEVHLFDWTGDLYDATITVHLIDRLRGQLRFADIGALQRQLREDAALARSRLRSAT